MEATHAAMTGSCITQNDSFSPLNLSEAMVERIMIEHNVRREFLDVVSSFYLKIVAVEEAMCLPFQMFETSDSIGELNTCFEISI